MTDKIDLIIAEIERLILAIPDNNDGIRARRTDKADYKVLNKLLYFINSFPEEPVSKDLEEAMNRAAYETRLVKARNGQPFFSKEDFNLGFSNGAQWQKEQSNLTWEDIPKILHHCEQLKTSWQFKDDKQTKEIGTQPFWEEVLKQFNEEKYKKDN